MALCAKVNAVLAIVVPGRRFPAMARTPQNFRSTPSRTLVPSKIDTRRSGVAIPYQRRFGKTEIGYKPLSVSNVPPCDGRAPFVPWQAWKERVCD